MPSDEDKRSGSHQHRLQDEDGAAEGSCAPTLFWPIKAPPHHAGTSSEEVELVRRAPGYCPPQPLVGNGSLSPLPLVSPPAQSCEQGRHLPSGEAIPPRRMLTAGLFISSILFLFADQNLLAPNLTAVARDFGFNDQQRDTKLGGQIPFAFFTLGGCVSVLIGPLADVMNRKVLYVFTVLLGTVPCLLTYWVRTFTHLLLLRTLTGVAVGGAFPIIYSLASDMTGPHQRAMASSLITTSIGVGAMLGQGVAGFVGPTFGWRLPFVIIAVPSIFISLLILLFVPEPARTNRAAGALGQDGGHASIFDRGCLARFMSVFAIKTNLLAFCQSIPGCLPWGAITSFLIDFLHQQKGLTVEAATGLLFVFGLGVFGGNIMGGLCGQWVYNRRKASAAYLMAVTTALGYFPFAWLVNAPSTMIASRGGQGVGFSVPAAMAAFCGGISGCTGPLVRAFVMNVNTSSNRGTVFSVFMVTDDLGKGLGPAIVASLIPSMGRLGAINLSISAWFPCAFFLLLMAFTINEDARKVATGNEEQEQLWEHGDSDAAAGAEDCKQENGEGGHGDDRLNPILLGTSA